MSAHPQPFPGTQRILAGCQLMSRLGFWQGGLTKHPVRLLNRRADGKHHWPFGMSGTWKEKGCVGWGWAAEGSSPSHPTRGVTFTTSSMKSPSLF